MHSDPLSAPDSDSDPHPDFSPDAPVVWRFDFRGTTGEFFRIWLVNFLLTVATLGLYSPWAKVRTRRYFHGSAFLNGVNFDYHASPWSILLARLVILFVLAGGAYWAGENLLENALHTTLIALLLPWAVVRGMAFNARYSSHRGAKFSFKKETAAAYAIASPYLLVFILPGYIVWLSGGELSAAKSPISAAWGHSLLGLLYAVISIAILVLLLVAPGLIREWHDFKARNHSVGPVQFHFEKPRLRAYYGALLGISAAGILAIFSVVLLQFQFITEENAAGRLLIAVLFSYAMMLFMTVFIGAALFRLFWNGVGFSIGGESGFFKADFTLSEFALKILAVNYLAVIFSLGLLYPWAKIRRARFIAERLSLQTTAAALDKIPGLRSGDESALGEEFEAAEGFDFDIGLV